MSLHMMCCSHYQRGSVRVMTEHAPRVSWSHMISLRSTARHLRSIGQNTTCWTLGQALVHCVRYVLHARQLVSTCDILRDSMWLLACLLVIKRCGYPGLYLSTCLLGCCSCTFHGSGILQVAKLGFIMMVKCAEKEGLGKVQARAESSLLIQMILDKKSV